MLAGSGWEVRSPGAAPLGGGWSHDLLFRLPTCCLLRRPLPGLAPGSGCLGDEPVRGESGGHLPVRPLYPAWSLRPSPPTPRGTLPALPLGHLVAVGPLVYLATMLILKFLISEMG